MLRSLKLCFALCASASVAHAHFVFIVPEKSGSTAKVILSEDLQPDEQVSVNTILGSKLLLRDHAGHDTPLNIEKVDEHSGRVELGAGASGVIYGTDQLGVNQRGKSKPALLTYYPKTVLGDPFDSHATLGEAAPVELIPIGHPGELKFQFVVAGKPAANAEVDVILPDGTNQKVNTDSEGKTAAFKQTGRFDVWARHVEAMPGEVDGKHYDEVRTYATLVIDAPPAASTYAPMPQPASSFGAVASDNWLYVYGGHIANTHSYTTESVSGQFHRLNLIDHQTWETLPAGPALQGLNLATWHGKIYRVGGMSPHNKPGEHADVRSVADCACFDPATGKWTTIAPLPEPRSSHDVMVLNDKLIVIGGWNLTGKASEANWLDKMLMLDLTADNAPWKPVAQPFHRRALISAAYGGKVYVIGGFETEQTPSRRVDIFDPMTAAWSEGPSLPGADQNGFGPAACTLSGQLYVSVADGGLYRLDRAGAGWEKVGATTPRIVHRLAPNGEELLVIGGAAKQKQLDLIEAVNVGAPPPRPIAAADPPAAKP